MPEQEAKFREGEVGSMSEADRAQLDIARKLNAVLRALPPGREDLVLDLAESVDRLRQVLLSEDGRILARDAEAAQLREMVENLRKRLKVTSERLAVTEESANQDPLTKLLNKGALNERGAGLFVQCRRDGKPLACVFVDLDYFKLINDIHGHPVGDRVLQDLAMLLKHGCRPETDIVARYGGEEFVLLLPGVDAGTAGKIVERLRLTIEQFYFRNGSDITRLQVTASLGCAVLEQEDTGFDALLKRADDAAYDAKGAGRNMAVLAIGTKDAEGNCVQSFLKISPEDRLRPRHAMREEALFQPPKMRGKDDADSGAGNGGDEDGLHGKRMKRRELRKAPPIA